MIADVKKIKLKHFEVNVIQASENRIEAYLIELTTQKQQSQITNIKELKNLCQCQFDTIFKDIQAKLQNSTQFDRTAVIYISNAQSNDCKDYVKQMILCGVSALFQLFIMKNIYTNIDAFCIQIQQSVQRQKIVQFVSYLLKSHYKAPAVLHGAKFNFKNPRQLQEQNDSYTVITGGSRGIGKETAEYFSKEGKNLVLTGRPGNKQLAQFGIYLQQKYKNKVITLYLNIADDKSCEQFAAKVSQRNINLQGVLFNAGVGTKTSLQQVGQNSSQSQILLQVNSLGPLRFLEHLQKKNLISKDTQLFVVSSVGSLRGFKQFHQIDVISKTVLQPWIKMLGTKYNIISIYPGATQTDMFKKSTLDPMKQQNKLQQFVSNLPKKFVIEPQIIGAIINACCKKQFRGYLYGNRIAACCGFHVDFRPL